MKEILILAVKGGVGKTTLAEAIRQCLAPVQIVDMDPQATLSMACGLAGISVSPPGAKYKIYDSPPYNDVSLDQILERVDHIIVPARLGYPDILSLRTLYERLLKTKTIDKALLVYNAVRKPLTLEAREVISCFETNYPNIKKANTHISLLDGFRKVFRYRLNKKALEQTIALLAEIEINDIRK